MSLWPHCVVTDNPNMFLILHRTRSGGACIYEALFGKATLYSNSEARNTPYGCEEDVRIDQCSYWLARTLP